MRLWIIWNSNEDKFSNCNLLFPGNTSALQWWICIRRRHFFNVRSASPSSRIPLLPLRRLLPRQERIVRLPLRHARRAVLRTGSAARVAHVAGSDAKKRATRAAILRSGPVRVAAHKGAVCGLMTGILLHYLRQMCLLLFRKHCRHLVTGTSRWEQNRSLVNSGNKQKVFFLC